MSTAFGYFGSKKRLAVRLCKKLPPHSTLVEAFCGSAALTFAKKPVPIEIINDLDREIVNFFEQLRDNEQQLCRAIALTPYAREELDLARKPHQKTTKLERARRFLVSSMMAINGVFGKERGGFSYSDSYARSGREARVNRWYNLPKRISEFVERLRNVRVENKDARKILKQFADKPAALVYLDPPYFADRTNGYNHDANDLKFHRELLRLANRARCMIFISGYQNALYRKTLTTRKGWHTKTIKATTRDSSGKTHERTEVVWMNKHFLKAQKTGRIPVRLSKREARLNKINPTR